MCTINTPSQFSECRFVFGVTSLLPLITSAVAVLVKEKPVSRLAKRQNVPMIDVGFYDSSRKNLIELWKAVRQPNVFLPTLFIFFWQATPQSDSAMFYFTYFQIPSYNLSLYFQNLQKYWLPQCMGYNKTFFPGQTSLALPQNFLDVLNL